MAAPLITPLAALGPAKIRPYNTASLDCMTAAIAYEAGNQPAAGQQAVGQVILNRVARSRYPKSVCGVVFAGYERRTGCQFTFTCDGSLRRRMQPRTIANARVIAVEVLSGTAPDRVAGATHYHANYVTPYWAKTGTRSAVIGAHIFYRMPGDGSVVAPGEGMASDETVAATLARRAVGEGGDLVVAVRPAAVAAPVPVTAGRASFSPWGLALAASN